MRNISFISFLAILLSAVWAVPAGAANYAVTVINDENDGSTACTTTPSDCSLREAIIEANGNPGDDTITFDTETATYTLSLSGSDDTAALGDLDITGDKITITGNGVDNTVIDADSIDRAFHVLSDAELEIEDLEVTNGDAGGNDGGNIRNDGTVTLTDCEVTNGTGSNGTGLSNEGSGTVSTVTNCTFSNNDGGSFAAVSNDGVMSISDSTITGNDNSRAGGLNNSSSGNLTLTSVTISSNTTTDVGGNPAFKNSGISVATDLTVTLNSGTNRVDGVIENNGTLTINNSSITDNTALGNGSDGGAIHSGDDLTITNTTISGNSVDDRGGAINSHGGDLTITGSTITNNQSVNGNGGGILFSSGDPDEFFSMSNTSVTNNQSDDSGGGVSLSAVEPMFISNSVIDGNTSVSSVGGGINVGSESIVTITNSTISDNQTTSDQGGGIFVGQDSTFTLDQVTIADNTSEFGGGLYANDVTTLSMVHSTVSGNTATGTAGNGQTGGVYIEAGTLTFKNNVLGGNTGTVGNDCEFSAVQSSGDYNVIGDTTGCGNLTAASNDLLDVDPLFDSAGLQDNGGPTETIALQAASPAINIIPLVSCTDSSSSALTTDQRGEDRTAVCDAGAFEYQDTVAPTVTVTGSASQTLECNSDTYTEQGATASDAVDGNLSAVQSGSVNTAVPGSYTVTYTATDLTGNEDSETRSVTVSDTTTPVITLAGDASVNLLRGGIYTDAGATATDVCDGDVTSSITTTNPVDTATPGEYTVRYAVSDAAGNSSEVTRTVTVVDTDMASIDVNKGNIIVTYSDNSTATFQPFGGSKKYRATLLDDHNAIVATNGKLVRVFDYTLTKVDQLKITPNKPKKKSHFKLFATKLYGAADYTSLFILHAKKSQARTTVMRLNANNQLTKSRLLKSSLTNRKNISVKFNKSKKRFTTQYGKKGSRTNITYKLTKKGSVKKVK